MPEDTLRKTGPHTFFLGSTWSDNAIPRHFTQIGETLAARGHRVVRLVDEGRRDVESPDTNPAVLTWPSYYPRGARDALFLRALIARHRPSCVVGNFRSINMLMLGGWAMRVPCRVAWYRGIHRVEMRDNMRIPAPVFALRLRRKRLVYRLATHIAAVSEAARDDARRSFAVPARKITTLYDGIADPLLDGISVTPPDAAAPRFVNVGRFVPSKGQETVLRAIPLIAPDWPQIRVTLIGAGPTRERCQRLATALGIAERCDFPGAVAHGSVFPLLSDAKAAIVASHLEAFGLAALEAAAMGRPVIATKTGGLPEIVRDGNEGFLFEPGDHVALADRMRLLLSDPELCARLGQNARQRFLDRFVSAPRVAEQARWLENIADEAVGAGSAGQ